MTSDDSPYTTESTGSSSASDSSSNYENQTRCRLKLNECLSVSGKGTINQPEISWNQLSVRTKNVRTSKAKNAVVAQLEVKLLQSKTRGPPPVRTFLKCVG